MTIKNTNTPNLLKRKSSLKLQKGKKTNSIKYIQIGGLAPNCDTSIGKGGFGIAYKCVKDGRIVAVLKKSKNKDDPMLQNEIDILSTLKNVNIIHYINDDESTKLELTKFDDPHYYLEYCNGGDIKSYLKEQKIKCDEKFVNDFFTQILSGLKYLYNEYIIHADIKEENILVVADEQMKNPIFKIADFGLSINLNKLADQNDNINRLELFKSGSIGYIPFFMRYTTYYRDLYAFFCILYFLIKGTAYNDLSSLIHVSNAKIIDINDLEGEKISNKIAEFIDKIIMLQDELAESEYINPDIVIGITKKTAPGYVLAAANAGKSQSNLGYYKASSRKFSEDSRSNIINGYVLAAQEQKKNDSFIASQAFEKTYQSNLSITKTADHQLYKKIRIYEIE